jgi:hypothetical protein
MAVYKRGPVWWCRFSWRGEAIRESTKRTNKRVAEQIEAAHKTSLAKGEVGIRDRTSAPTIRQLAKRDFLPFYRATFAAKPKTLGYYENGTARLLEYLAGHRDMSIRKRCVHPQEFSTRAAIEKARALNVERSGHNSGHTPILNTETQIVNLPLSG